MSSFNTLNTIILDAATSQSIGLLKSLYILMDHDIKQVYAYGYQAQIDRTPGVKNPITLVQKFFRVESIASATRRHKRKLATTTTIRLTEIPHEQFPKFPSYEVSHVAS